MTVNTTKTGVARIKAAESLLLTNCSAINPVKHTGACITNIIKSIEKNFSAPLYRPPGGNPAYCAATSIMIDNNAFPSMNTIGPFTNCRNCVSSLQMIAHVKKLGIRFDNKPAPGCVGFTKSSVANSGFHTVALIWQIEGKNVVTIEGNSNGYHLDKDGCYIDVKNGVVTKKRPISSFSGFAHVEEWQDSGEIVSYDILNNSLALSGLGKGEYCLTALPLQTEQGAEDTPDDDIWLKINKNLNIIVPVAVGTVILGIIWWRMR